MKNILNYFNIIFFERIALDDKSFKREYVQNELVLFPCKFFSCFKKMCQLKHSEQL